METTIRLVLMCVGGYAGLDGAQKTMGSLLLESLEIQGYRALEHLRLNRLGRVNLITGRNSVGKSCVLEALTLYARGLSFLTVVQVLHARQEVTSRYPDAPDELAEFVEAVRGLFHGWPVLSDAPSFRVGPIGEGSLKAEIRWAPVPRRGTASGGAEVEVMDEDPTEEHPWWVTSGPNTSRDRVLDHPVTWRTVLYRNGDGNDPAPRVVSIPANGLQDRDLAQLWDAVALTDRAEQVLAALDLVVPGVSRLHFAEGRGNRDRVPQVRIDAAPPPTSLRLLGEGLVRALGIALALVNAADGLLLIDEVESGLHYSVQEDLWRLIFATARDLNVQVFATTHSWDCVEGFQRAAVEDHQEEGYLIRLQQHEGGLRATTFDEEMLTTATREDIEVR